MRTHTTAALLAITGLLALPAGALAGGWATVGLSSTPDGLAPGTPWKVDIEVLQHGRTPLDNVHPTVTITSADGSTQRTFATRPAGRPGVHRAIGDVPARRERGATSSTTASRPAIRTRRCRSAAPARPRRRRRRRRRGGAGGDGGLALDRLGLAALAGARGGGARARAGAPALAPRGARPAAAAGS